MVEQIYLTVEENHPAANKVRTTGLAGGLLSPYKGLLPACARKAH